MDEKTEYKKRLENNIFYSFEAPFLVFSDFASKIICKQFGITHKELRTLAGARLFMNVRQFARTDQLIKVMKYDKFFMSMTLRDMAKKDLLVRVEPKTVNKRYGRVIKSRKHYYKIGKTGKKVIDTFNSEIIRLIREFDDERNKGQYTHIKINDKHRAK